MEKIMNANIWMYLCIILGISSALVGGVFQAFSDFVMRGLARCDSAAGIQAMQHINKTVFKSVFLYTFLALMPASIVLAFLTPDMFEAGQYLVWMAAAIYGITVFGVTIIGNVPMNENLDRLNYSNPESHDYWIHYVKQWTRLNHIRTLGAIAAAICYLVAAATI